MTDTAGNQDNSIVTNGTAHTAMTQGSTDICLLADKKTPAPFFNYIKSRGHVQNGTTNTTIAAQTIMTKDAWLGPQSLPAHAGVGKGVKSTTYIDIAEPTSWSKDVKTESLFVVRTNDKTTQNKRNTTGYMEGDPLKAKAARDEEYMKMRCAMMKVEGHCVHKGRKVGFPPGQTAKDSDANYLEVLGGDEITLTATRQNLITGGAPACTPAIHTKWRASRKYKDTAPVVEEKTGTDTFVVGSSLTNHPEFFNEKRVFGTPVERSGGLKESTTPDYRDLGEDKQPKSKDRADGKPAIDMTNVKAIAKAGLMWNAAMNPPEISVEALACGGAKKLTFKVLPYGPVTFNFFDDSMEQRIKTIKDASKVVEKLANVLGQRVTVKFLEDPQITLKIEYKELTEDRPARTILFVDVDACYAVQVRKAWELEFGFNPMLGVSLKFTAPVLSVVGGAIGAAVARALAWVDARADLALTFEISFNPKGTVKWDEYSVWSCTIAAELKPVFYGSLEIRLRVAEVILAAGVEGTIRFDNWRPDLKKGAILGCDVGGQVQFFIKGSLKVSFLGLEDSEEVNWKPEWGKFGDAEQGKKLFMVILKTPL